MRVALVCLATSTIVIGGCKTPPPPRATPPPAEAPAPEKAAEEKLVFAADVAARIAKFAPTEIDFDEALLSPADRVVLKKLVQAGQVIGRVFLRQVSEDNPRLRDRLVAQGAPPEVLDYFDVMYGPWDELAGHEPFVGDAKKPLGASFYPPDLTREELERWIAGHPDQAEAFRGYFTVIRRQGDGLRAIPYSEHYADDLGQAAALLREAAQATQHPALKRYLETRAAALLSNEYRESDMAWMDLGDSPIEVVIGPYEVYEDRLMGYKAAFETFVTLRDPASSDRLKQIGALLPDMEKRLPLDRKYMTKRGLESPISVVIEVFTSGDAHAGVQTAAFNLPNDEKVREEKGSKKVMLKNVMEAKFNRALVPIAERVLYPKLLDQVRFDPYFTEILLHELAHGMGPGKIEVAGRPTEVNRELKDLYPAIEECKADIVGLVNGAYMIKKKHLPEAMARQLPATYVAGVFRAIRFGTEEAHARAVLLGFNYLREKGAVTYDAASRRFGVDYKRFDAAVRDLAGELLLVQARGSYDEAKALLDKYGHAGPEVQEALTRLGDVPVDIRPDYTILRKMAAW